MKKCLVAATMTISFAVNSFGASPLPAAESAQPPVAPAVEEFNGPFASWKNLKTDFGAVGTGSVEIDDITLAPASPDKNERAAK